MTDQKPPRLAGTEFETIQTLLRYQRGSLVKKVSGVTEEAARQSPVASGTSLLWLMKHMARAESLWILDRFSGQDALVLDDAVHPDDTLESAVASYQESWRNTDAVVAAAPSLDEVCRNEDNPVPVNLRWVLMHLLEETARHAGHADVLRELIDGATGR